MILAILVIFVTLPFWITRNILYSWDLCEICRLCKALLCLSSFKFRVQSVIKFVIPAILAILVTIFFQKQENFLLLLQSLKKLQTSQGISLPFLFWVQSSVKFVVLASLVILFTFVVLAKFADFSRAFFTFLLYTTELLLNLLFLQIFFCYCNIFRWHEIDLHDFYFGDHSCKICGLPCRSKYQWSKNITNHQPKPSF